MTKCIFLFFMLVALQSIAQQKSVSDSSITKLILAGVYSGKNIYVSNPAADDTYKAYCTDSIVVNGKRYIINLNQSVYEINLDSIVKIKGTDITIIIYHKKTCSPHPLISIGFPPERSNVEFTSFDIDSTGRVHFTTRNEQTGNRPPFQLEQLRGNEWRSIVTIPQKWEVENTYDTIVPLTAGQNTFRLSEMLYEKSGKVITVESGILPIKCAIDPTMNCIVCSDTSYFEIQTPTGVKLSSGYEKKIDISFMKNGSYVLIYENQRLLFDIKRSKKKKA